MDTVSDLHRWQSPFLSLPPPQTLSLAFLPRSKEISDLPNEILILVFVDGCEVDNRIQPALYRRVRYPLISVVRGVCTGWKNIVDSEDIFNKQHFWFTSLQLSFQDRPFIHQVHQFYQALTKSQECDLDIKLILPWTEEAKNLSSADAALLDLFIRAINFLVPHQKQITVFRIDVSQPQFMGHLLHLFATKLNYMTRHPLVVFDKTPLPLAAITSKLPITPPSICTDKNRTTSPSCLLPRLSEISFARSPRWDLSWMNGRLMKFPFVITHLKIPELSLHKNYEFFNTIRNELVSLTITSSNIRRGRDATWDITPQSSLNTIDFPKLWHLRMSDPSSGSGWSDHFFKNASCARLEVAEITGISEPPSTALADSFDPTIQFPGFPNLQKLIVEQLDVSQYSLFLLAHLASPSVRELSIGSLSFNGCGSLERWRVANILRMVFRHARPEKISLVQSCHCEVLLLEILNFDAARELTISELHGESKVLLHTLRHGFFGSQGWIPDLLLPSKLEIQAKQISPKSLLRLFSYSRLPRLTTLKLKIDNLSTPKLDIDGISRFEVTLQNIVRSLFKTLYPPGTYSFPLFPELESLHLKALTKKESPEHENEKTRESVNLSLVGYQRLSWQQTSLRLRRIHSEFRFAYWEHEVIATSVPQ